MSVLDPNTPWPYLLYVLAGAGVVAWVVPRTVKLLEGAEREAYNAQPQARMLVALTFWVFWPLVAALLLLTTILATGLRIYDFFTGGEK